MKTLGKTFVLALTLLTVVGVAWPTAELSPAFSTPQGGYLEILVWITPNVHDMQIPEICERVQFTPVVAGLNGVVTASAGVVIEDIHVDHLDGFELIPGEVAKFIVPNENGSRKHFAVEFEVSPETATDNCGPKASAQVIDATGRQMGSPVSLNDNFKSRPSPRIMR